MAQIAEMRVVDNHMPAFIKKWINDVKMEPEELLKVTNDCIAEKFLIRFINYTRTKMTKKTILIVIMIKIILKMKV